MALPRGHVNIASFCHDILIMGYCMGYSFATLPQQIPANTGHWPNAATDMTHRFQRRPILTLQGVFPTTPCQI